VTPDCDCGRCRHRGNGPQFRGIVNRKEFRRLCNRLGVTLPVKVYLGSEVETAVGHHRFNYAEACHEIHLIDNDCTCAGANEVLIHELTHAAQFEQIDDFSNAYWEENERVGYRNNRYEHEANRNALTLGPLFDICPAVAA
jgi:hypothetical protein